MADLTAQELIDAALRVIGAVDPGETPSSTERTNALEALKIMLRQWSSKGLFVFVNTEDTHTLTSGTKSYTIGSGATINTTRPVKIINAYVNQGGLDYQIEIIGESEYVAIADKDLGYNYPSKLWYQPGYSTGTIYIYPPGGGTLHLFSQKPLTEPGLSDDITFPGVYDAAIKYGLAVHIAPEYGGLRDPMVAALAQEAYNDVIGINASLAAEVVNTDILSRKRGWSIDFL